MHLFFLLQSLAKKAEDLALRDSDFYPAHDIEVKTGAEVGSEILGKFMKR